MAVPKYVYLFGEGNKDMRDELGGKGANLAEMTNAGLPVPPGFIVTTGACMEYQQLGGFPPGLEEQVRAALAEVEKQTGKKFGQAENLLLVSVRSGAKISMPGMMETVLNLGLNDETVQGLAQLADDERFAYDAYRRLLNMFGDVVLEVEKEAFDEIFDRVKEEEGVERDTELDAEALKRICEQYKVLIQKETGQPFPQDPWQQLMMGIEAVFKSWNVPRAVTYRQIHKLSHDMGTAVNVQTMVFGNLGDDSGTGVAFTRDPATGEDVLYGDYLVNAQGEDVVAGRRTPMPIAKLQEVMPDIYAQFEQISKRLERHYKDIQDLEFTVERGKLWMLQTRNGKRTAQAAIKVAVDMVNEGLITPREAVMLVEPEHLDHLLHEQFDPAQRPEAVATGVNASPGAAAGFVVFSADDAAETVRRDPSARVVLVRRQTSPDDVGGMKAAQGVLTAEGGKTSHAAVVARGMGKACVAGCAAIDIDYKREQFSVNGQVVKKGDYVSIDGTTGEVMLGDVATVPSPIMQVLEGRMKAEEAPLYQYFATFMPWADEVRRLGVRTNADTPEDAALARALGAEGIGLTRTEHMFFGEERLPAFQRMILAENSEEREAAAAQLLPHQREDFKGILEAMDGLPVIIRLLDPPLHEFLPQARQDAEELAEIIGKSADEIEAAAAALHEANPMLGHRGCRLGVTFPEVYRMQVRAIFEAACELKKEGKNPIPEVMIPLVGILGELEITKRDAREVAEQVMAEQGVGLEYMIGTMIELPRAALCADEIAREAEFFSFGTNDLTQTTFGFSRDDVEGKFIPDYVEQRIVQTNPFDVLDREGVGQLVRMGTERGRQTRPDLEVGICGEHGGEPNSVEFCHLVGMDYVSCSPLRVPIARLAAAQAVVREERAEAAEGQ
ncbi:MAG: pyruvate, phosphate dikinase [Armatimonadota bacterium]